MQSSAETLNKLLKVGFAKNPEQVALIYESEKITYDQLDQYSTVLAGSLKRKHPISKDKVIALYFEKTIDMVIALVAIIESGCPFLLIDPSLPIDRVSYMLESAGAQLVIASSALAGNISALKDKYAIEQFSRSSLKRGCGSESNPKIDLEAFDLSYILYTSGSTGVPKGVQIENRSIVQFFLEVAKYIPVNPDDLVPSLANYSFDISLLELLYPLTCGATVVLFSKERVRDTQKLCHELRSYNFKLIQATPAIWEIILQHGGVNYTPYIISGGDSLSPKLARKLQKYTDNLYNAYGPTEATIWASLHRVSGEDIKGTNIPIGEGLDSVVFKILDENQQPIESEHVGELYIGGSCVARGYSNQPDLTKKAFIQIPIDGEMVRMYRTGDRVKFLSTGSLIFIGRADGQVKIRGHRIELSEVESLISSHKCVDEAYVRSVKTEDDKILIAYVKLSFPMNWKTLKSELSAVLPSYMIPARIIILENFPLNQNGKIDISKLPTITDFKNRNKGVIDTPVIDSLLSIYSKRLGITKESLDIDTSFFDYGGDSLSAVRATSDIAHIHSIDISLSQIFRNSTIRNLSAYVTRKCAGNEKKQIQIVQNVIGNKLLALSSSQERIWYMQKLAPDSSFYNVCAAYVLGEELNVDAFIDALKYLIRNNHIFRLKMHEVEGKACQNLINNVDHPHIVTSNLIDTDEDTIKAYVRDIFNKPISLNNNLAYKFELINRGESGYIFLIVLHHSIIDGWGLQIFYENLAKVYAQFDSGLPPEDQEKPDYLDYVLWVNDYVKSKKVISQTSYWLDVLEKAGQPRITELRDHSKKKYKGNRLSIKLSTDLSSEINIFIEESGSTVFTVFTSLFSILLSKYSQQENFVIGTTVPGRHYSTELQDILGIFVNIIPLPIDISSCSTFRDVLDSVQKTILASYDNQDIPFNEVVSAISNRHGSDNNYIPNIMIVYQTYETSSLELPGVFTQRTFSEDLTDLHADYDSSKFDLTLYVSKVGSNYELLYEYDASIFSQQFMGTFSHIFNVLMQKLLANSNAIYRSLVSNTALPANCLSIDLNPSSYLKNQESTTDRFEKICNAFPDKIAVIDSGVSYSYRQLQFNIAKLAKKLLRTKSSSDYVAICMDRSVNTIIAMLGILKAGKAFVAINGMHSISQITHIINQTSVDTIVGDVSTSKELNNVFIALGCNYIDVEQAYRGQNSSEADIMFPEILPNNTAYVMYTSGSTGFPKGAMIEQNALSQYIDWFLDYADVSENSIVDCSSNIAFDFTLTTLLGPLCAGSTVSIISDKLKQNPEGYLAYLSKTAVTHVKLTPSYFNLLLKSFSDRPLLHTLKHIILGGEEASKDDIEKWLQVYSGHIIHNEYGPTEATIAVSQFSVKKENLSNIGNRVPVSTPQKNLCNLYVVDNNYHILPKGAVGELLLGEGTQFQGYLQDSKLTEQSLIQLASLDAEQHLYKTGDLAKMRFDGSVEYFGRKDDQIKLRGYRVNLDQIKRSLEALPYISRAEILPEQNKNHQFLSLTAFVIPNQKELYKIAAPQWEQLYETMYATSCLKGKEEYAYIGWTNSFTGTRYPDSAMIEWADNTAELILSTAPSRVLEIGSGTGLIAKRLIPHCSEYLGTDFSPAVIGHLNKAFSNPANQSVQFISSRANEIKNLAHRIKPDTIILNSVAQYFPTLDYLTSVITQAIELMEDGGNIFIGDIRSYEHCSLFNKLVCALNAEYEVSGGEVLELAQKRGEFENELLISQKYFFTLQEKYNRIASVEIHLKRDIHNTEMALFRYDVILRVGNKVKPHKLVQVYDCKMKTVSINQIKEILLNEKPEAYKFVNILHELREYLYSTLAPANEFNKICLDKLKFIENAEAGEKEFSGNQLIASLYEAAKTSGYLVNTRFSRESSLFCFDAIFIREDKINDFDFSSIDEVLGEFESDSLANIPIMTSGTSQITKEIKKKLELAAYEIPDRIIYIDEIPLNRNEKIDFKKLFQIIKPSSSKANPETEIQIKLYEIWENILGVSDFDLNDNFFDTGGHSLLSLECISRIEKIFGVELSLSVFRENATILGLEKYIQNTVSA